MSDEKRRAVFDEIDAERQRQDAKWGEQNHPMVPDGFPLQAARDVIAQVLDLGGRREAASLMRELCELVEAVSAQAIEFHELLEVAATICEGSEEPPSQYEIEVHHRNGGHWLLAADGVVALLDDSDVSVEARRARPSRWWALDKTGKPCRRPRSGR